MYFYWYKYSNCVNIKSNLPITTKFETDGGRKNPCRKHQGIIQSGGNKGKLRKGYKYSGKTLKNGLSQIIKVPTLKNKNNKI